MIMGYELPGIVIRMRATTAFYDINTKRHRGSGEEFAVLSLNRARRLAQLGVAKVTGVYYNNPGRASCPKVIIYQDSLARIGGIETWCQNVAAAFLREDIAFVVGAGDAEQILQIGKYHPVLVDDGYHKYACDVLIASSCQGVGKILDRTTFRKFYQWVHADFSYLLQQPYWKNFEFEGTEQRDGFIAISETARRGLKEAFEEEAVVAPGPVIWPAQQDAKIFLTLSRATSEKGMKRVLEMAQRFQNEGREFLWLLCTSIEQCDTATRNGLKNTPGVVIIPPNIYNTRLMEAADYLVQLSDSEAFCYSVQEALQAGIGVIMTDIPAAKEFLPPAPNHFVVKLDLSDLDTDKIFSESMQKKVKREIPPIWDDILKGEL